MRKWIWKALDEVVNKKVYSNLYLRNHLRLLNLLIFLLIHHLKILLFLIIYLDVHYLFQLFR